MSKQYRYKIINELGNSLDDFLTEQEAIDFLPQMKEPYKWKVVSYEVIDDGYELIK